jgi:hypothetical protein
VYFIKLLSWFWFETCDIVAVITVAAFVTSGTNYPVPTITTTPFRQPTTHPRISKSQK